MSITNDAKRSATDAGVQPVVAAGAGAVQREWEWASQDELRSLLDIPNLLNNPEHPAQLVVDGNPNKMAYIHIWDEKRGKYVRSFHFKLEDRHTISGIQYGEKHKDYNLTVDITDEEWAVVGKTSEFAGVLLTWAAGEMAKDPVHYLGDGATFLTKKPFDTDMQMKVDTILTFTTQLNTSPAGPAKDKEGNVKNPEKVYPAKYRIKVKKNPVTGLTEGDIFDKANPEEPLYWHPKFDNESMKEAEFQQSVFGLNLPKPTDLVSKFSRNDQSFTILGWSLKPNSWTPSTRLLQLSRVTLAGKPKEKRDPMAKPTCRISGPIAPKAPIVVEQPQVPTETSDAVAGGAEAVAPTSA